MKSTALNTSNFLVNFILAILGICMPILLVMTGILIFNGAENPLILDTKPLSIKFDDMKVEAAYMIPVALVVLLELGLCIYVLLKVRTFLNSLRAAKYFTNENVDRLKSIGFWLIVIFGIYFGAGFLLAAVQGKLEISISLTTMVLALAIAIVYVLADIFEQGVRIQKEQDLTI